MSRFASRFVIFPTLGGGAEPGRADRAWPSPRPGQRVIFSNHGPKPDVVCEIPIHATSARPASEFPISLAVCPAWLVRFSEYFSLFLRVESPPPRVFEAATCSLARALRLLWEVARCLKSVCEEETDMSLYRPSDTVGAAWVTYCLDQAYIEPRQNVTNRDFMF